MSRNAVSAAGPVLPAGNTGAGNIVRRKLQPIGAVHTDALIKSLAAKPLQLKPNAQTNLGQAFAALAVGGALANTKPAACTATTAGASSACTQVAAPVLVTLPVEDATAKENVPPVASTSGQVKRSSSADVGSVLVVKAPKKRRMVLPPPSSTVAEVVPATTVSKDETMLLQAVAEVPLQLVESCSAPAALGSGASISEPTPLTAPFNLTITWAANPMHWTLAEHNRLRRALQSNPTSWAHVASIVATKIDSECEQYATIVFLASAASVSVPVAAAPVTAPAPVPPLVAVPAPPTAAECLLRASADSMQCYACPSADVLQRVLRTLPATKITEQAANLLNTWCKAVIEAEVLVLRHAGDSDSRIRTATWELAPLFSSESCAVAHVDELLQAALRIVDSGNAMRAAQSQFAQLASDSWCNWEHAVSEPPAASRCARFLGYQFRCLWDATVETPYLDVLATLLVSSCRSHLRLALNGTPSRRITVVSDAANQAWRVRYDCTAGAATPEALASPLPRAACQVPAGSCSKFESSPFGLKFNLDDLAALAFRALAEIWRCQPMTLQLCQVTDVTELGTDAAMSNLQTSLVGSSVDTVADLLEYASSHAFLCRLFRLPAIRLAATSYCPHWKQLRECGKLANLLKIEEYMGAFRDIDTLMYNLEEEAASVAAVGKLCAQYVVAAEALLKRPRGRSNDQLAAAAAVLTVLDNRFVYPQLTPEMLLSADGEASVATPMATTPVCRPTMTEGCEECGSSLSSSGAHITCAECERSYHLSCLQLPAEYASTVSHYTCPKCYINQA